MRSQCCHGLPGRFDAEAMQYDPQVGLPFVNAPVAYSFAMLRLSAMRHSDEFECHEPRFVADFLPINLNSRSAIQPGVVGPRGLANQA